MLITFTSKPKETKLACYYLGIFTQIAEHINTPHSSQHTPEQSNTKHSANTMQKKRYTHMQPHNFSRRRPKKSDEEMQGEGEFENGRRADTQGR